MKIQISLSQTAWWDTLTKAQQEGYLKEHPRSKRKVTAKPGKGKSAVIPPDKFKASDWASQFDDKSASVASVLKDFPPDTADKIKEIEDRLKKVTPTDQKYKKKDGSYTAARKKLHQKIYKKFFGDGKEEAAKPADGEKPTFTMLGGRGGSGKSWFKGNVYDPSKAIVLDADAIKEELPEYKGWNAHEVHEESSDILEDMLKFCREKKLNVVLDATMKTTKSALEKVDAFKGEGFGIEAHYMFLPRQEAAKRAVSRSLGKSGRFVPPDVVLSNTTNEASFDEIKKHADNWSFRNNNVARGEEPIVVSASGGGRKASTSASKKKDDDRSSFDHYDMRPEKKRTKAEEAYWNDVRSGINKDDKPTKPGKPSKTSRDSFDHYDMRPEKEYTDAQKKYWEEVRAGINDGK